MLKETRTDQPDGKTFTAETSSEGKPFEHQLFYKGNLLT
jgi:hypothetical protein